MLIAGGMRRNQDFCRSVELYDPATGKFQPTGTMAQARAGHAAILLHSGKVLVVGGYVGHNCTDSAEIYDPANGKFTDVQKMTALRGRPSITLLANGDVLITGEWIATPQEEFLRLKFSVRLILNLKQSLRCDLGGLPKHRRCLATGAC